MIIFSPDRVLFDHGHQNEFFITFLIKMLIRTSPPKRPGQTSKMKPGRGHGHQNELFTTFLIKELIRTGHPERPGQTSKMKRSWSPKCVLEHFLILTSLENQPKKCPCENVENDPSHPKWRREKKS